MTPDEDLATRIADRLANAGLIDPARRDDLAAKVAAGKATPDDWRLWVELRPTDPDVAPALRGRLSSADAPTEEPADASA